MYRNRRADELDDATVEAILAGRYTGGQDDLRSLSATFSQLRDEVVTTPVPKPNEVVAHILETGQLPRRERRVAARTASRKARTRRRVLAGTSTVAATLTGKVLIGAVAVAAGVGGAHASGVVDVPGLSGHSPAVEAPPASETENGENSTKSSGGESGADADRPGVDGESVSDRATNGEPVDDGKAFGKSVSEEAVSGTPGAGQPADRGSAADERKPDGPAGGRPERPDNQRPDDAPTQGVDPADEGMPDSPPVGRP